MKKISFFVMLAFVTFSRAYLVAAPALIAKTLPPSIVKPDIPVVVMPAPNGNLNGQVGSGEGNGGGRYAGGSVAIWVEDKNGAIYYQNEVAYGGSFFIPASTFPTDNVYSVKAMFDDGSIKIVYRFKL